MNTKSFFTAALLLLVITACTTEPKTDLPKHVILLGWDGLSSKGLQQAHTPTMDKLMAEGASTINMRVMMESSSSQNWMSMLTGAIPVQHGVIDNGWEPDNHQIEPMIKNKAGFFPSIFDAFKDQRPNDKLYYTYHWGGLARMFDMSRPDKVMKGKNEFETMKLAEEAFFADLPEFLFIDIDQPDGAGHYFGHDTPGYHKCIYQLDSILGGFIKKLEEQGLMEETVLIVTSDHGGNGHGHGGQSPQEMEVPFMIYGKGITKGKILNENHMITDVATTAAKVLGVKLDPLCIGRCFCEAFSPKTDSRTYLPMPLIKVTKDISEDPAKKSVEIEIAVDGQNPAIHYTTDGTTPTASSPQFNQPFMVSDSCAVKAVSVRDGFTSTVHTLLVNPSTAKRYVDLDDVRKK